MSNIIYIATSIDGYIARKDGDIDWLMEIPNPENNDFGFSAFMKEMDGIIMGRRTFEQVVSFGQWLYAKPVFVLSNSMKSVPSKFENKVEIVSGSLASIIDSLNKKGYVNLYIDGGKTIQSFLKQNLIDEIIITMIPIILGSGIPLFAEMDIEIKMRHVETEIYNNTLVKSRYKRIN